MKSTKLSSAQWMLTIMAILITFSGYSQRSITWKGGTPGKKNDWYCPQNWSSASVPDEFSDVVIPDVSSSTFAPPEIKSGVIEINSLIMYSNTLLTLGRNAILVVTGNVEGVTPVKMPGEGKLLRVESPFPVASGYMAGQAQ